MALLHTCCNWTCRFELFLQVNFSKIRNPTNIITIPTISKIVGKFIKTCTGKTLLSGISALASNQNIGKKILFGVWFNILKKKKKIHMILKRYPKKSEIVVFRNWIQNYVYKNKTINSVYKNFPEEKKSFQIVFILFSNSFYQIRLQKFFSIYLNEK